MRLASVIKLAILLGCSAALADSAGHVTHLSGPLLVVKPDGAQKALAVDSAVESGDTLITADKTYARVKFADEGEVTLRPGSQVRVESFSFDAKAPEKDTAFFKLVKGAMRSITGLIGKRFSRSNYRLETATATIGIRGTTIFTEVLETPTGPQTAVLFEAGFGVVAPANAPQLLVEVPTGQTFGVVPGLPPTPMPQPPGLQQFTPPANFPASSQQPPPPTGAPDTGLQPIEAPPVSAGGECIVR